jgi:hypothetical protein
VIGGREAAPAACVAAVPHAYRLSGKVGCSPARSLLGRTPIVHADVHPHFPEGSELFPTSLLLSHASAGANAQRSHDIEASIKRNGNLCSFLQVRVPHRAGLPLGQAGLAATWPWDGAGPNNPEQLSWQTQEEEFWSALLASQSLQCGDTSRRE